MISHEFKKEDFQLFREEVNKWVTRLGITGWDIEIRHEQIGNGTNAQCVYNTQKRHALFRLTVNTEGDFGMTTNPSELALHEVLHLLLADLVGTVATLGDDSHTLAIGKEHEVINRLSVWLKLL